MSKERAQKIKVILFDVDGVLTDGTIWLFPSTSGQPSALEKNAAGGGYGIQSAPAVARPVRPLKHWPWSQWFFISSFRVACRV